jgi:hypothetical protein
MLRSSRPSRALLVLLATTAVVLAAAPPADAHKQGMRLSIGPVAGNTSPVQIRRAGVLLLRPFGGGKLTLSLHELRTPEGVKLNAPGNELRLSLRVNGVPKSVVLPFAIVKGEATVRSAITPAQPLFKGDVVEVVGVDLVDQGGIRFGTIGVPAGTRTPIVTSSLVYVVDSTSAIHFSRGGDTRLKLRDDGNFNSGFDTLLDANGAEITHPGVRVELGLVRNGVPSTFSYTYDIVRGRSVPNGRPVAYVGLSIDENVEVTRLDVYDGASVRFATLGLRITAPPRP